MAVVYQGQVIRGPKDPGYHAYRVAHGGGAFGPAWRPHLEFRHGRWVARYVWGLVGSMGDLLAAKRHADNLNTAAGITDDHEED
jgi:hypothetical protein